MPPVWCPSAAPSARPRAASTLAGQRAELDPKIAALRAAGIRVSLFIAADPKQIEAAAALGAPVIEIHTGAWCHALVDGTSAPPSANGGASAKAPGSRASLGLEVHAGHGLDYASAEAIAALPEIAELNIGHFLIGEAVFTGLAQTVKAMRAAMDRGRARGGGQQRS